MDNTKQKEELFKKIQLGINIFTVVAMFALMLYLTVICPYISDDWHFKFVWRGFSPDGSDTHVSTFAHIIESMKNYYKLSGGRVLCHGLAYIFININKVFFNIANGAMFAAYALLMYKLFTRGRNLHGGVNLLMLTAALSSLLFIPRAGDVFIWTSGSVNYLWSAVIMMFAMWAIDKCFEDITLKKALLMSIPVAISAATNETTGGMLIVFMVLTFIVKKKKFSPLYLIPVIAALPGMALVILAPGNSVRAQSVEHVELMTMATMVKSARAYIKGMLEYFLYFFLITAFAFLLKATDTARQYKGKEYLKQMFYLIVSCRFFIMGFIGTMALCAASYTSRPLIFGGTLFIVEAGAAFIDIMNTLSKRQSRFKLTVAEAGCLLLAVGFKPAILRIGYKKAFVAAAIIFVILCAVSYAIRRFAKHTENIQSVNTSAKNTSVAIAGTIVMAALAIVLAVGTVKNVIYYNDNIGRLKNYLSEVTVCLEEKGLEESRKLYYKPYENRSVFIPYLFEHSPTRYSLSLYSLKWYELCLSVNDT